MSDELEMATQQVAKGDYNRAIDTLNRMRLRPVDADELRGLLEIARRIQGAVSERIARARVDRLIAEVEAAAARTLEAEMGTAAVPIEDLARDTLVYVSTTFDIPGFQVVAFHDPVFGLVARSRSLFTNLGASAKALVGEELQGLTSLLVQGRGDAPGINDLQQAR